MKTKYVVVASVILIIPFLTQAAWWNPSTWSKKTTIQPAAVEAVVESPAPIQTVEVEKIVEKVIEKPVEKVIYRDRVQTVADQTVVTENTELRAKIAELELKVKAANSQTEMCKADLSKYEKKPEISSLCKDMKDELEDKQRAALIIREDLIEDLEEIRLSTNTDERKAYLSNKTKVSSSEKTQIITNEITRLKYEINLFCK